MRLYFRGDDGQTNEGGASRPPSLLRTAANTDPSAANTDAKPGEAHGGGENMHIGELSRRTGVSVRSIRHYDDNGLLGARRGENGYRIFDEAAVRRVLRIKQLIHHGLTVEEIRPMAACLDGPADEETVCDHVIALYEQKLRAIDDEIAALRAQRERVAERLRALNLRRTIDARLGGHRPTSQPIS